MESLERLRRRRLGGERDRELLPEADRLDLCLLVRERERVRDLRRLDRDLYLVRDLRCLPCELSRLEREVSRLVSRLRRSRLWPETEEASSGAGSFL